MNTGDRTALHSAEHWTEQDLDSALASLLATNTTPPPEGSALVSARGAMFVEISATTVSAAQEQQRRSWPVSRRAALIAAFVLVVTAGGLILPSVRWEGKAGNTAAAEALNQAADGADRTAKTGDVIPTGEYRYIDTSGWYLTTTFTSRTDLVYLRHERQQTWIPADLHDLWVSRSSSDGQRQWIDGTEKEAIAVGDPAAPYVEPDRTGHCQLFGVDMCRAPGSWQTPTQAWIDSLPDTADAMWNRLYDDSKGSGTSHRSEMFVQAIDGLRSGLLPASTRATLYRAMARIDGVELIDHAANLDGQTGVAFRISGSGEINDTIIDIRTGNFIGERTITLDESAGAPAGTVTQYTTVRTSIQNKIQPPGK